MPELKDVAGHALDGEVFVERADERVVGLEDDAVVGHFRNGAAGRDGQQPRMPAAAQATVHLVAVEEGRAAAAARREAVRGHRDHGIEILAREVAVRPRAPHQGEELVFGALAARGFGDDLLGQHVERRIVRDDAIQLAGSNCAQKRRALDEIVARGREEPSFGRAGDRVARSADALQHGGDAVRRSDLADEVDVADVDAELERCGGDQRLQRPVLQTALRRRAASPSTGCRGAPSPRPSPRRSLRCRATRSAIRRVLTNTRVVRCAPISSVSRS